MVQEKPTILAIDDDLDLLETYKSVLAKKFNVLTAPSGGEALKIVKTTSIQAVLLDIRMPKMDGIKVLEQIKQEDQNIEVIMVTASKDLNTAIEAMKLGAYDYVIKPFDVKELIALIEKALEKRALRQENTSLKESLEQATSYCDLLGQSRAMQKLFKTISSVAPTNSTVLIHGESGTGKELVARAIHKKSTRADKPFIAVNCGAIPENLFESELFGHERGSFTGAMERRVGKFELADGGTLFLDEIGCMPPAMQAKLLRVLEDRKIERLGGEKSIPIDIRLVSATNIDFDKHIEEGKFRQDLYFRLNVIPIELTPLRQRKEDIPLFLNYFINKFNKILNKNIQGLEKEAMAQILAHSWPGNVRELQNMVERLVVLSDGEVITKEDLPFRLEIEVEDAPLSTASLKDALENFEVEKIKTTLQDNSGNITQAAKKLKMPRSSLISRMRALGIS